MHKHRDGRHCRHKQFAFDSVPVKLENDHQRAYHRQSRSAFSKIWKIKVRDKLKQERANIKWDIIGLSKTRRKSENRKKTQVTYYTTYYTRKKTQVTYYTKK